MGTGSSKFGDDSVNINFVGRDEEFEKVRLLLNQQKIIGIYGARKIGKSRFLTEMFRRMCNSDTLCIFKDFELDNITSPYLLNKWLCDIFILTDTHSRLTDFKVKFQDENRICGGCNKCLHAKMCEHWRQYVEKAVHNLIEYLQSCSKNIFLFLDNIDKLLESVLNDPFLRFINDINEKCSNINLIFCSSIGMPSIQDSFERIDLGPLDNQSILKIIFLTTEAFNESSNVSIDDEEDREVSYLNEQETQSYLFKNEYKVFTLENKVYMKEIASLCNGFPVVAIMSGTLLTEDDGLLTPTELIDILQEIKLKVYNPDYELPSAKEGDCESPMQQLELIYSEILYEETKRKEHVKD